MRAVKDMVPYHMRLSDIRNNSVGSELVVELRDIHFEFDGKLATSFVRVGGCEDSCLFTFLFGGER